MNTTQTLTLYHGSHEQIGEIVSGGAWDRFGGVFAAVERRIAESHGPRVHVVEVDPDLVALRRDLRDEFADDDVTKASSRPTSPRAWSSSR